MAPNISISSRFETSTSPTSSMEWKCLLQEIKLMYIRRQYKLCATRSLNLLHVVHEPIHPVYKTYLYFYCAISYEAMGRAAHNYSSKKISLLHSALDCFITCSAILPSPITSADEDDSTPLSFSDSTFASSDRPSSSGSLMSDITDIIDRSIDSMEDDPFVSDTDTSVESLFTSKPKAHSRRSPTLIPPPLKVQKPTDTLHPLKLVTGDSDDTSSASSKNSTDRSARAQRPPPLPIKIVPFGVSNSRRQRKAPKVDSQNAQSPPRPCAAVTTSVDWKPKSPQSLDMSIQRYNSGIQALHAEINASIAAIHRLVDEVTGVQETRRSAQSFRRSASFWSFSPVKEGSSRGPGQSTVLPRRGSTTLETMEQRIARLRADGWNSVGLRDARRGWKGAEYYQAYCAAVLGELYLKQ